MRKYGPIANFRTGDSKSIDVGFSSNFVFDLIVGSTLILSGAIYLAVKSFYDGSDAYDVAEFKTLKEIGLTDGEIVEEQK